MKKCFIVIMLFALISAAGYAQKTKTGNATYKSAIGIRYYPFGISFKSNTSDAKNAIEINGFFKDGFILGALYERNFILNQPKNLRAYIGGGGHIGFLKKSSGGGTLFGVDGVIGLDYKLMELPLAISLDWMPTLQFGKRSDEFSSWGGLGVRFAF